MMNGDKTSTKNKKLNQELYDLLGGSLHYILGYAKKYDLNNASCFRPK